MTDYEIIKALECHASDAEVCKLCPLTNEEWCSVKLARNTLDLINRQKAEIEALIAGQETLQKYIAEKNAEIEKLQKAKCVFMSVDDSLGDLEKALEENERQNAEIERLKYNLKSVLDERADHSEAIKEFAERLKERFLNLEYGTNTTIETLPVAIVKDQTEWIIHEVSIKIIDSLAKEMVCDAE